MKGFRGYVSSRPFQGQRVPQHVQNLVLRDYCQRRNMKFLLSVTEYTMPDCMMMFDALLGDLEQLEGIVAYSLFQMPRNKNQRLEIYENVLGAQRCLHFAVETISLSLKKDIARIEDIWSVYLTMYQTPNSVIC